MTMARDADATTEEASGPGELTVRLTALEAQANTLAVLQLCAAGKLRCSEKTQRPGTATVAAVAGVLLRGDFHLTEPNAAFAWPLLVQVGGRPRLPADV